MMISEKVFENGFRSLSLVFLVKSVVNHTLPV